jgi:DNA-binding response OmpR family regulator
VYGWRSRQVEQLGDEIVNVLIADRDAVLVEAISSAVKRAGHVPVRAANGQEAHRLWKAGAAQLVVLDTHLHGMNGFELCRQIRLASTTPVILLSNSKEEVDILRGFQLGADDYVTKPLSITQLLARIDAMIRRQSLNRCHQEGECVDVAGLRVDRIVNEVHLNGKLLHFTPIEFRMLYILTLNSGRVISMDRLAEYTWGHYTQNAPGSLNVHIGHIRKKLAASGEDSPTIKLVRSVGYSLVSQGS